VAQRGESVVKEVGGVLQSDCERIVKNKTQRDPQTYPGLTHDITPPRVASRPRD